MHQILLVQLMLVHFISDFLLQNDYMAQNKSRNFNILSLHSLVYSLPFLVFGNFYFVCFLYTTHWMIDGITSKITSRLFGKWFSYFTCNVEDVKVQPSLHYFFCVIGFDQFLHFLVILAGIYLYNIK